jgi:hypothetical protein
LYLCLGGVYTDATPIQSDKAYIIMSVVGPLLALDERIVKAAGVGVDQSVSVGIVTGYGLNG